MRSLNPVGGEYIRTCFLGSTGRGGASACLKNRLLGPSTSTYFVDGRTEATECDVLAGDDGRSASVSCSSMFVAIAALIADSPCAPPQSIWRFNMQSLLGNKIASRTKLKLRASSTGYDPRYQLCSVADCPLCLLAVQEVMQSGRVVATLAFGGEEKLAINVPATGVYCCFFFMSLYLLKV